MGCGIGLGLGPVSVSSILRLGIAGLGLKPARTFFFASRPFFAAVFFFADRTGFCLAGFRFFGMRVQFRSLPLSFQRHGQLLSDAE